MFCLDFFIKRIKLMEHYTLLLFSVYVELKGGDLEMFGENYYSKLPGTEPRENILPKPIVPIN